MAIDKSDFDMWMDNPVTKKVFDVLEERRDATEEYLVQELSFYSHGDYNHQRSFGINCYEKGKMYAYNELLKISFEEVETKEGSDEQVKAS